MSNVSLEIAGRKFVVACDEGEEPHIEKLGRSIAGKIQGMPGLASPSVARCRLVAALLLADEVSELRQGSGAPADAGPDLAEPFEALAERLEALASQLENGAA